MISEAVSNSQLRTSEPLRVQTHSDLTLWPAYIGRVHPAPFTDFEEAAALLAEVNADAYSEVFPDHDLRSLAIPAWRKKKVRNLMQSAQLMGEPANYNMVSAQGRKTNHLSGLWSARLGEKLIGLSGIKVLNTGDAMITRLHVLPEHQGKYVGHLLLSKAIEAAGSRNVLVEVHDGKVKGFYEKLGFEDIGPTDPALLFDVLPIQQRLLRLGWSKQRGVLEGIDRAIKSRVSARGGNMTEPRFRVPNCCKDHYLAYKANQTAAVGDFSAQRILYHHE